MNIFIFHQFSSISSSFIPQNLKKFTFSSIFSRSSSNFIEKSRFPDLPDFVRSITSSSLFIIYRSSSVPTSGSLFLPHFFGPYHFPIFPISYRLPLFHKFTKTLKNRPLALANTQKSSVFHCFPIFPIFPIF